VRVRIRNNSGGFRLLYDEVTRELRDYAVGLDSASETRWFNELIDEFEIAYERWEHDPRMRLALKRIDRVAVRAFQVTAHAYIHIGYDLPCCISTCLRSDCRPPGLAARDAYFRAREVLCETFDRACGRPDIFGAYGYGLRVWRWLPFLKEFPFGIWASDLRERSFHLAEQLLVSNDPEMDKALLWRNVARNLKLAGERRNPFSWLRLLSPPDLPDPKHRPDILDVVGYATDVRTLDPEDPGEGEEDENPY
jgi:hypothetical protein